MTYGNRKWTFLISRQWMRSNLKQIVSIRVTTLSITNVVAPRRVKRENVSFPVAVRRSKTPLLKVSNLVLSTELIM